MRTWGDGRKDAGSSLRPTTRVPARGYTCTPRVRVLTIGTAFARIQRESDAAQAALQTTVAQRRLLLASEERVRGQVAAYLHDRVQTDLVSIGLRMRSAMGLAPEQMAGEIEAGLAERVGLPRSPSRVPADLEEPGEVSPWIRRVQRAAMVMVLDLTAP